MNFVGNDGENKPRKSNFVYIRTAGVGLQRVISWFLHCVGSTSINVTYFMCVEWNYHYVYFFIFHELFVAILFASATILR